MKRIFQLLLLASFTVLIIAAPAEAQRKKKEKLSKEEKKAKKAEEKRLKAEVKAFSKDINKYKAFKEAKETAESELSSTRAELTRVKELEAQCAKEVEELRAEIEDLRSQLAACNKKPSGFSVPSSGLYYVVQIGAYQSQDLAVNDNNPDFRKDFDSGLNKYIMGVFSNLAQADRLRNFLMQLNFQVDRPFIQPYRDGTRISMDDALGPDEAERRRQQNGGY